MRRERECYRFKLGDRQQAHRDLAGKDVCVRERHEKESPTLGMTWYRVVICMPERYRSRGWLGWAARLPASGRGGGTKEDFLFGRKICTLAAWRGRVSTDGLFRVLY